MSYNDMPNPLFDYNGDYSTYKYLRDNLGENHRANLLEELIKGFADLSWICPYYITSVEGLNDIIAVDPKRGTRVKQDGVITLKCIEGLDMRINALMNIYKKIAWDDVYQRWILPYMMRYFKMNIYISEFRIFHENKYKNTSTEISSKVDTGTKLNTLNTINRITNKLKNLSGNQGIGEQAFALINSSINELMPTICFECSMCEFDISDIFSNLSSISIDNPKQSQASSEIKIKIGNITEKSNYGLFINSIYLHDNDFNDLSLPNYYDAIIKHAFFDNNNYNNRTGLGVNEENPTTMFDSIQSKSSTYVGNLLKNSAENLIYAIDNKADVLLNKALNKDLLGGMSVNDTLNALNTQNIFGIINTIKGQAALIKANYPELSSATSDDIDDVLFKNILENIINSEATNSTIKDVLSDILELEKIKNNNIDAYKEALKDLLNNSELYSATSDNKQNNKIVL